MSFFESKKNSIFRSIAIYRKGAYVGHIGKMVRNDFDHEKKYQDLFFIKGNLG